jgi:predicted Zn finger-like uncharacterized protein
MILDCTACSARYLLADSAIGAEGRQVRCARCGHSWVARTRKKDQLVPLATLPRGQTIPFPVSMAPEPKSEWGFPTGREVADGLLRMLGQERPAYETGFRSRRNPARAMNWFAAGMCIALLAASGTLLALGHSVQPAQAEPVALAASAQSVPASTPPLQIAVMPQPTLTTMANGSMLFAVSGKVRNPTSKRIPVPDVIADLRDNKGKPIYSWTIHMPRSMLGPGESLDFDSSQLDVPADVKTLRLGFLRPPITDEML